MPRPKASGGRAARPSLRDEDGVAIAVTIMVMTIGFALASVGSVAAMSSLRNAARDSESSRALAVAEAGAEQALRRHNKILTADGFPCLVMGAGGDLIPGFPLPNGWCPTQTGVVEDGTFSYAVKPPSAISGMSGQLRMTIVAEGMVGGEVRRIAQDATASTGAPAFAEATVIGEDQFVIDGNGTINANVATNADFELGGNATICGSASHGIGRGVIISGGNAGFCNGSVIGEQTTSLSPPDAGDVANNNDNGRFFSEDTAGGKPKWNPSTRELKLTGSNDSVTLGGSNYSLCKLEMSGNSSLFIALGATVRIWFDSPENCGYSSGVEQLSMIGNSKVLTTSGEPFDAGFLFVGSSTLETKIKLAGNGIANDMMIYAPLSEVTISGNGNYSGAIAAKEFIDNGNGTVSGHDSVLEFEVGVQTSFDRERFLECIGPLAAADPAAGC